MKPRIATKAIPPVNDLIDDGEGERLRQVLEFFWREQLESLHAIVILAADLDPGEFRLDDEETRRFLQVVRFREKMIDDTTRDKLQAVIIQGQADGLGTEAIIDLIDAMLAKSARARAENIARTEIGQAQRDAAVNRYRASGVVSKVKVRDGDGDEPCASRNGKTFPLDDAPDLAHPRCVLILIPIVDL